MQASVEFRHLQALVAYAERMGYRRYGGGTPEQPGRYGMAGISEAVRDVFDQAMLDGGLLSPPPAPPKRRRKAAAAT